LHYIELYVTNALRVNPLLAHLASVSGTSANIVAWTCFALGVVLVLAGVWNGLRAKPAATKEKVDEVVADANTAVERLEQQATNQVRASALGGDEAAQATEDATQAATEAKGKLSELSSLVGSLPEHLRFAGLLIVIGAALISVATVQFGGTSLF
jgi:hypothetical protein